MHCVITIFAAQNDRGANFPVPELPMRALPTGHEKKPAASRSETNYRILRGTCENLSFCT
jgi:hypothetical protein